jgi:hypothetical protein
MVPSRENMLEAFKDAKGKPGSVGGPFVGGAGSSGGSGASARERAPRGNPRPYVVAFAALALSFVLGVLVGRGTAPAAPGEVQAAGGEPDALEAGDALGAADDLGEVAAPEQAATPAAGKSALSDARNKYTIVAISLTPANENLAWLNVDHLRAQGLAAEGPIQTPNGMLAVVVGAAPKESDLADTKARLQRLSGPNGKGRPYEQAYTYPIRKLTQKEGD